MQNKKMWQHIYIRGRKGKLEINTLLQSYCKNVELNHQLKKKRRYTYSFNTP